MKVLFILGVFIEFSLTGCVSWICSNLKNKIVVERNNHTIHMPFQYLELKKLF